MNETSRSVQTGYPLGALFVLLAACAVVSALLSPVARAAVEGDLPLIQILVASLVGLAVLGILGGVIGLYHYRPIRGAGWGMLTGGAIGVLIGPLMLAPPEALGSLVTVSLGGSVVVLITGAVFGFGIRD